MSSHACRWKPSAVVALGLGATALCVLAGCTESGRQRPRRNAAAQAAAAEKDHLALALAALKQWQEMQGAEQIQTAHEESGPSLAEFEQNPEQAALLRAARAQSRTALQELGQEMEQAERIKSAQEEWKRQLLYHLNRWSSAQGAEDTWRRDGQVDRLPRRFRDMPEFVDLDRLTFDAEDAQYLFETYWLHSIARWVADDASRRWIESLRAKSGNDSLYVDPDLDSPEYRLHIARSLFDWTVRHIQLDAMLPVPTAPAAAKVGVGEEAPTEQLSPPEQGIPGPGYLYYPHQVLRFGHGDAWQRARVFILLARQMELDAVMLAVDDRGPGSRANLWCPAVLIAQQLYLFDTALGLPLPGAKADSVATLSEVLADPALLRKLDVQDQGQTFAYPVTAAQLRNIAALADGASEALTRRMQLLESRLPGENALVLTVSPTSLAKKVRACPGLERIDVRLWTLPYETRMFRKAVKFLAKSNPQVFQQLLQEQEMNLPSVERGRRLHLVGRIEPQEGEPGAITLYMRARKSDEWIEEIRTSAGNLVGSDLTPEQQQFVLSTYAAQYEINKQHASFWIGLAQYDLGQYEAAIDWLKDRSLEAFPDGVWTAHARYNLARAYEALGRIEDARKLYYQSEGSPQHHGDLLRARLLQGT